MVCEHNRRRYYCVECKQLGVGGSGLCKHDRRKNRCRLCGGASICEHNKSRHICIECKKSNKGGGGICEHDKIRRICRRCKELEKGGQRICEHNKNKSKCKICQKDNNSGSICQHNKTKYSCKECKKIGIGGNGICHHGKSKSICKECKGRGLCVHLIPRSSCKECGVINCVHGKNKYRCKLCHGSQICCHNNRKDCCIKCKPHLACNLCFKFFTDKRTLCYPYCLSCYIYLNPDKQITKRYMMKEHYLRDYLKEKFPNVKMVFNKTIDNGCSKRRPDVRIECFTHTIVIECDERQHKRESSICEESRLHDIYMDLACRPLLVVRFNPDNYNDNGAKHPSCFTTTPKTGQLKLNKTEWNKRVSKLFALISQNIDTPLKQEGLTVIKLFYDN